MSIVSDFRALLDRRYRWNGMTNVGKQTVVTYSFYRKGNLISKAEAGPYGVDAYQPKRLSPMTGAQKTAARKALKEFSRVSGVTFVEVRNKGMLRLLNQSGSKFSWAVSPYTTKTYTSTSYLFMATDHGTDFSPGSSRYETLLHEVGHALGLKHPFEGDPQLADHLDNDNHTVMSYTNTGIKQRLGPIDVDALRKLYGKPVNWAKRGMKYAWNQKRRIFTANGGRRGDVLIGVNFRNVLNGKGGKDALYGRETNDKLNGGPGSDKLFAGSGNDALLGSRGADKHNGGYGSDAFRYLNPSHGYDLITDFYSSEGDRIEVKGQRFGGLEQGALSSANFVANTAGVAESAEHFFVFNTATSTLFYDPDGSGEQSQVKIAKLNKVGSFSHNDIVVI